MKNELFKKTNLNMHKILRKKLPAYKINPKIANFLIIENIILFCNTIQVD